MEFEAGKILELRRGDWRLDLAPQAGGRVFGLRAKSGGRERDLIVPVPSDLPLAKALANAGCYPLVPFSNRIENARFCAAGRLVQLSAPALGAPHAIHGYGWTAAWAVEAQDESEAELCYRHPAGEWPWAFSAHLRF